MQKPDRLHILRLRLGAASLLAASLLQWFGHPPAAWQDGFDGLVGLLYGAAIGFMLMSLRSRSGTSPPSAPSA